MKSQAVHAEPVWVSDAEMPSYGSLGRSTTVDVCIIGAGIAGLTTAYLLAREGKKVIVLDDGSIAGGMTTATSAHLANAIDNRYFEIERLHGVDGARLTAESHTAAIDTIEQIVRKENIDCDFERLDGYLFLGPEHDVGYLHRELAAACRAGLPVEFLERSPNHPLTLGPCLRFPRQAQFHPLKYLAAVAKAIHASGGRLCCNTHADEVHGGPDAHVKVGQHTIRTNAIVVATNVPINDMVAIHTKQAPYMTYVIAAAVPAGVIPKALYWDTHDPYHYVRLQEIHDVSLANSSTIQRELLIVGGEDHKTGQATDTQERHARLELWARERFPMMEQIEYAWGGQVMETMDGLAFIGRNPMDADNVFIVTGDCGMGLTHGTIAGMLITDLIFGRSNPWEHLFDPSRKTVWAADKFLKENVNVAVQYLDWITPGSDDTAQLAKDSGTVVRRGLHKVAVYCDAEGNRHECSAVCPHLGCIVAWNGAEKTWDCPCHGSRFDKLGHAINGPANSDLAKLE